MSSWGARASGPSGRSGGGGGGGGGAGARATVEGGAAPATTATTTRVKEVRLDGLVVLKMIKHCQEYFPESVAGSLLGLDVDGVVEVTHSFPYPKDDAGDGEEYELKTMVALREVNVDNNAIGWYQSTYLGSYCTKDTITHQFEYQEEIPNSVVIIYDSVRTAQGQLSIKALRLTDAFRDAYRSKRIAPEALATLPPSSIFEELPLRIANAPLIQAVFADLAFRSAIIPTTTAAPIATSTTTGGTPSTTAVAASTLPMGVAAAPAELDFSRLDLSVAPLMEKHLEILTEAADTLLRAQWEANGLVRKQEAMRRQREEWLKARRAENEDRRRAGEKPLPEEDPTLPFFRDQHDGHSKDALELMLMSAQISNYCSQVSKISGATFGKLYLAGSLHK